MDITYFFCISWKHSYTLASALPETGLQTALHSTDTRNNIYGSMHGCAVMIGLLLFFNRLFKHSEGGKEMREALLCGGKVVIYVPAINTRGPARAVMCRPVAPRNE